MTTMDMFLKIWCPSRARIGAKARGISSHHAEELSEVIVVARTCAIAFDCGTGRDCWSTFRRCL